MDIASHAMARKWWESCFGKNSYAMEIWASCGAFSICEILGKHHWIWFD